MLICGTRLRAIPALRGKPPKFFFLFSPFHAQAQTLPLHSFIRRETQSKLATVNTAQRRLFCCTRVTMTAQKIDGTAIAKSIREKLNAEIQEKQKSNPRYKPSFVIIQGSYCSRPLKKNSAFANIFKIVGDRPDSSMHSLRALHIPSLI
jgi:hypothetical protein